MQVAGNHDCGPGEFGHDQRSVRQHIPCETSQSFGELFDRQHIVLSGLVIAKQFVDVVSDGVSYVFAVKVFF